MITADDEKHRVAATGAGVSVLLSKPYPEDHLLAWLEEALDCTVAVMG
jgi:CheY-like chemotaxis protein